MNREALEQLYDAHAEAVFRFLCALVRDEHEARDHLQDLFLKVARSCHQASEINHPRAYLMRIARNLVIDASRRRATRRSTQDELPVALFAPSDDPDQQVMRQTMALALANLPDDQREVVYLKLYEELTFEAIASLLQIPQNTAASRYRYGMTKLRQALQPLYDDINEDA